MSCRSTKRRWRPSRRCKVTPAKIAIGCSKARGRPLGRENYDKVLKRLARELPQKLHVTPHQLRHTFATSLMNGGMSLPGIMKLLGHKDYRMTLRYTPIADETVGREYFEALSL